MWQFQGDVDQVIAVETEGSAFERIDRSGDAVGECVGWSGVVQGDQGLGLSGRKSKNTGAIYSGENWRGTVF